MIDSIRPAHEVQPVTLALLELAVLTRDHTIDAAVVRTYLPHLDRYTVAEVQAACHSLATADWFPKLGELLKACSAARRRQQDADDADQAARLRLTAPQPSAEEIAASEARKADLLARMRARFGRRTA